MNRLEGICIFQGLLWTEGGRLYYKEAKNVFLLLGPIGQHRGKENFEIIEEHSVIQGEERSSVDGQKRKRAISCEGAS